MKRGYDKAETNQFRKTKCQNPCQIFIKFTNTVQTLPLAQLTQILLGSRLNQELKQHLQAVDSFDSFFSCRLHCVGVSTRLGAWAMVTLFKSSQHQGVMEWVTSQMGLMKLFDCLQNFNGLLKQKNVVFPSRWWCWRAPRTRPWRRPWRSG